MLGNRDSQRNKITTSASTSAYNRLDIEILSTIGLQIPNAEGLLEAENSWSQVPNLASRVAKPRVMPDLARVTKNFLLPTSLRRWEFVILL